MEILDIVSVNLLMQFVVVDGSWGRVGYKHAEMGWRCMNCHFVFCKTINSILAVIEHHCIKEALIFGVGISVV